MCKDYGVSDIVGREEIMNLVKDINMKIVKNENLNSLDYDGF